VADSQGPATIESLFARYGPNYRWLVTITAIMGTVATVLTATIVNVALPDIMGTFGMSQDQVQLLSTAFLAAMTGTMLLNAWLVDSFGQRATFTATLAVFIAASLLGGVAPNDSLLVLARILQGGASGILQPLAMQVVYQVFPPEKRGMAMGIYGFGVVLAPAVGPALGGMMVDNFSWRYVFFLAVPFCAVGLLLGLLFMPGRAGSEPIRRFDWAGFGLLSLALVTLLDGLSHGQRDGWQSHRVLVDFVLAAATGIGFIAWELRTPTPLLNPRLFTNRVFASASLVSLIFGAGLFGSTYLIPLFVQTIQGYTPTNSGLLLIPAGLMLALTFPVAGRLTDLAPAYAITVVGLLLFAVSSFLMTRADIDTPFWHLVWWIVIGRIGLALVIPAVSAGALKALPLTLLSQGSGAISFMRQFGGALGVNLLSIALERRTQFYVDTFASAQHAGNGATLDLLQRIGAVLSQSDLPTTLLEAGALHYVGQMVYVQGNTLGYRDSHFIVGAFFMAALLPALLMRQRRHASAA